jgi:hypothetical protein
MFLTYKFYLIYSLIKLMFIKAEVLIFFQRQKSFTQYYDSKIYKKTLCYKRVFYFYKN